MTPIHILNALLLMTFTTICLCKPEGNIFVAVAHMEPLVEIERRLVKIAREYLNNERRKLDGLKHFAQSVEEAMNLSKDESIKYLGNPINSYLIIKRFTSGWSELANRLTIDDEQLEDIKVLLKANEMYLPVKEKDLEGATNAILRLQDTFDVTTYELAEGKIEGTTKQAHQLTAQDCLDIANTALSQSRYFRMMGWLKEAERIMNDPFLEHRRGNTSKAEINEFLAWAYYLSNNMKEALRYTNLVLEDDPTNEIVLKNKQVYLWYVSHNKTSKENETRFMEKSEEILKEFRDMEYVKACQMTNPTVVKVKNASNLVCFYKQDAPRIILKPIKTTRIHDNPEIYIFHDVLSDTELEKLKDVATPRLQVAKIVDPEDQEIREADYRVAKTMFLNTNIDEERILNEKFDSWFADITGLDMECAESLQMNNYGLGGQYEFHHDHGLEPGQVLYDHEDGNRIATVLLYLSDVERGGQTVFTKIGLSLPPNKGDAVFWYNLHKNGTGIWDTEHASCPVISGSKWVANKWVHAHGNEFKRRCSFNQFE